MQAIKWSQVYLSLGANLGNSITTLAEATRLIQCIPELKNFRRSHDYITSPLYNSNQPDFINAVCGFSCGISIQKLWHYLTKIEIQLGKQPKSKIQPRYLDIDLLFFDKKEGRIGELLVPHPKWQERLFVLLPLSELTSEVEVGSHKWQLQELISNLLVQGTQKCLKIESA